jgi:hypothetical protein
MNTYVTVTVHSWNPDHGNWNWPIFLIENLFEIIVFNNFNKNQKMKRAFESNKKKSRIKIKKLKKKIKKNI